MLTLTGIVKLKINRMLSIFSKFEPKMTEKAQGTDLLSLSKTEDKTNINSSPLGPAAQSLGE